MIVKDFNIPSSVTDTLSRQKFSKDIVDLKSGINQLNLLEIY